MRGGKRRFMAVSTTTTIDKKQSRLTDYWTKSTISTNQDERQMENRDSLANIHVTTPAASMNINRRSSSYYCQSADVKMIQSTTTTFVRNCPQYKRIPNCPYVVDAFNYGYIPGIVGYFLSHFHSDHYDGLDKSFNRPIFCSQITANLIRLKLGVAANLITVLTIGQPIGLSGCNAIVTCYDANHCPGSIMFLFESLSGVYLHSGDIRAERHMIDKLNNIPKIDILYLDTTYMDEKYRFPSSTIVIDEICRFVAKELQTNPDTLLVCGTYTIGKERVFEALADMLKCTIAVNRQKLEVMKALNNRELINRLTLDQRETRLFLRIGTPTIKMMQELLDTHQSRYRHAIGIWPSGWTFVSKKKTSLNSVLDIRRSLGGDSRLTLVSAPYSEHSSFDELRELVIRLRPMRIIPTVNCRDSARMQTIFAQWLTERRE